ncbi:hypothetical protein QWZ14_30135 [Paeniroseomonas aquatica]|uniref:Uncharacterized protein n=1 Tax=Paeniroseomonas aquatica TaxID=373043 RepID=A0ABT8AGB2_9PROT|nr:hypothetical protein [Paeniroseomonas aquatica]MDN3568655.1 hypothetical protein [Paeniroseomonas aquatica]
MSKPAQMQINFDAPIAFPLSPRAAGRLAARQRHNVLTNPHPEDSFAWTEWRAGWGLVWGIPESAEGKAEYLRLEFLRLWGVLTEIRDNPDCPQRIRDKATRALTLDKAQQKEPEVREG